MSAIDELLATARLDLERVHPRDLEGEVASGAVVIDTRGEYYRRTEGALPRSIVLERNVLEWRLDPSSPFRIPEASDINVRFIVVCNEGFGSSIAARSLQQLGLHRATDLIGGYRLWFETTATDSPITP